MRYIHDYFEPGLGYESYSRSAAAGTGKVRKASVYVDLAEDLLPGVSARARYFREGNLDRVFDELFDGGTLFEAEMSYALAPGTSISGVIRFF